MKLTEKTKKIKMDVSAKVSADDPDCCATAFWSKCPHFSATLGSGRGGYCQLFWHNLSTHKYDSHSGRPTRVHRSWTCRQYEIKEK